MSWRTGRRPWSLAARMTAWYGLTTLAVAGSAVAAIYLTVALVVAADVAIGIAEVGRELHARPDDLPRRAAEPDGWLARATDPAGRLVAASPTLTGSFPPDAFPPHDAPPVTRSAADGRRFALATAAVDGWTYQVAFDRSQEDEFFAKVRQAVALAVLPTLAVGLAVGYLLARLGLRPVRRLAREMQGLSADHLDARVATGRLPAELRELADALNAVLGRLEEAFARLDQFSADVAHELRTPVHNVRQVAEVVLAAGRGPADDRQALGRVLDEADRLTRLIERLLLFARLADPRAGLTLAPVQVADELAAAADFFAPAAAEAGVTLTVAAPPELTARLDDGLFQRAVSNLLANALTHTPRGGEVGLEAGTGPGGLRVEVRDTGRGIAAADLPRLFDRFYRSPEARAGGRGVGLGLAIVRRAVELHGGTVTVESAPGAGTRVRLDFPAASHDTDVIPLPPA